MGDATLSRNGFAGLIAGTIVDDLQKRFVKAGFGFSLGDVIELEDAWRDIVLKLLDVRAAELPDLQAAQLAAQAETIDNLRGENERQTTEHTAIRALNIRLASTLENREAELTAAKAENERLMGAARELATSVSNAQSRVLTDMETFDQPTAVDSALLTGMAAALKSVAAWLRELGLVAGGDDETG